MTERNINTGPFYDFEKNLRKAIANTDEATIKDIINHSILLAQQNGGKVNVTRILWKAIIEAPPDLADFILSSLTVPFDFGFIDDINGRTCLHEAATAGSLRLVELCLQNAVQTDKADVYGRSALHYACMNGHSDVCRRLVEAKLPPNTLDMDTCSPLVYATLKGNVDCVRTLLEEGNVSVHSVVPLALASQSGHVDVVKLLLQHGAKCLPNSNGQYPVHLAAREGHVDICKLLVNHEGWDTPDKYHEWTPLFHAARHGHDQCIQVLLEAGCRVNIVDEVGHLAVHYAAWYGHHGCVDRLLEATVDSPAPSDRSRPDESSPVSDMAKSPEAEIDQIPSLSLPPPIMSHRVYGHNYLDRSYLVQVSIGRSTSQPKAHTHEAKPAVRLHRRVISPAPSDEYLLATTPLKLVMTTSADVNSAPYSFSLPQRDEESVFTFQIPSLDKLSLEFSIYPNLGTKTIGRAVALPSLFNHAQTSQPFVLPILDHRLHVAGEVNFVTLQIDILWLIFFCGIGVVCCQYRDTISRSDARGRW
jgi:CDK inhibitor PHO81